MKDICKPLNHIKTKKKDVLLSEKNLEISGNKVTITLEEYKKILYQVRYYKERYSQMIDVISSQARVIENYVKIKETKMTKIVPLHKSV